jgi:hypothetical protein
VRPATQTTRPQQPQPKVPLTDFIRRQLVTVAERDQQRSRLVNVLIVALALLTVATIPGYVGTARATLSLALIIVALVVYLVALVTNTIFKRTAAGAYVLVVGGGLVLAGHSIALAANGDALQSAHAALLLPVVILIAGLLFVPEVTLITAFIATASTAFALLYGLANDRTMNGHDAYLVVVYTLGLQLVTALVSWLLAQFIYESALESQRVHETEFAQARLDALNAKKQQDDRQLADNVSTLQLAITRAMANDYGSRAELDGGPLFHLAESLNLLLSRFEAAMQAEQRQWRIDGATLPLVDAISRMTDFGPGTPSSLPIITDTSLDSVSVLLSQMQAALTQRLGRIQRIAGEVSGVAANSANPLAGATEGVQEAQRIGGKLIADAERALQLAQRYVAIVLSLRQLLSRLLPDEITRSPQGGKSESDSGALLGLGHDLGVNASGGTGIYPAVGSEGDDRANIAPMTVPLPVLEERPDEATRPILGADGDLPAELVDTWHQIGRLHAELEQLDRLLRQFARDLGVQSRNLRTVDANIAWLRSAIEAIGSDAGQLQQLAGQSLPLISPTPPAPNTASRPLRNEPPAQSVYGRPGAASQPHTPDRTPPFSSPLPPDDQSGDHSLADLAQQINQDDAPPASSAPVERAEPPAVDGGIAPGSLRATDLISLDGLDGSFFGDNQP